MSQVDEAVLDLTVSEAALLADVLGVAPPPGLVDPDNKSDAEVALSTDQIVSPGLVERRLLDAEGTVAAPVADLLTVVGAPHLVARAVREVGGRAEVRSFAARPEMAVEQRDLGNDLIRFTPFDPLNIGDRVGAFVLPDQSASADTSSGMTFEAPGDVIESIFDPTGSSQSSQDALVAAGVDAESAAVFQAAADAMTATNSVTVLHRPAQQEVVGVDLTWMDSGHHGLWLIEQGERGPQWRLVEQVSAPELMTKLVRILPFG